MHTSTSKLPIKNAKKPHNGAQSAENIPFKLENLIRLKETSSNSLSYKLRHSCSYWCYIQLQLIHRQHMYLY